MNLSSRIDAELASQRSLLSLRGYRQELLAGNIANADTPHYKARDVNVGASFAQIMAGRLNGGPGMAQTHGAHFAGTPAHPLDNAVAYRTEYQSAVDGNTVNMDIERAAFAENAIHVEALLTFIRGRFQTLQSAVQGQ